MTMTKETEERLAGSLTAETTELLPFLPYLLQDFWELGSDPGVMAGLIGRHAGLSENARVLDLACGKGAISVNIARELRVRVKGVDLIPEFVEIAVQKADEFGVGGLCGFTVGDINEAVQTEKDHDCVIFGAAGNILGDPAETLAKLKATVRPGGFILIDECYLPDGGKREDVKYGNYEYLTERQWAGLFREAGLELLETVTGAGDDPGGGAGMEAITRRANELIEKHPDQKAMFEGYIRSQQNEYDDIDHRLVGVTWILRKI
jgi:SAM-dependent methyltransferase